MSPAQQRISALRACSAQVAPADSVATRPAARPRQSAWRLADRAAVAAGIARRRLAVVAVARSVAAVVVSGASCAGGGQPRSRGKHALWSASTPARPSQRDDGLAMNYGGVDALAFALTLRRWRSTTQLPQPDLANTVCRGVASQCGRAAHRVLPRGRPLVPRGRSGRRRLKRLMLPLGILSTCSARRTGRIRRDWSPDSCVQRHRHRHPRCPAPLAVVLHLRSCPRFTRNRGGRTTP